MDETYFPTAHEFFVELPLYTNFKVTKENFSSFIDFARFGGFTDTYCAECGKISTFNVELTNHGKNNLELDDWAEYYPYVDFYARCSRNKNHVARYNFKLHQVDGVMKVGQYPSIADADSLKIKKYRKALSKEQLEGFTKAVRLASAGVGAGAVVYLRRIFESLIDEAHKEAGKDSVWLAANAGYKTARVADKVKALKSYLPLYLVEHSSMYSVLSSGVHDMSEQECLELFPVLKIGIELILKQKLQAQEEQNSIAELKKMLSRQASK
ncbi:hypothetical protein QDY63_15060 [Pseudomonas brenneri]|uniref:hypothetical protein n=1 Tax=Pseudomonas brenneri TaxID=129817 RepID=UPI0025A02268|nr:hypothetical protein [Pseudomonas brenneri]WJM88719.1 hypothetical protein QDY63_15060 [Pseudomonas brenneri]